MAKRPGALDAIRLTAAEAKKPAKGAKAGPAPKAAKAEPEGDGEMMTTAIHLPRDLWNLLRRVSFARAEKGGGRASVSAVLVQLVKESRDKLEREAG